MEEVRSRLMKCFSTVFPALTSGTLANANTTNTAEWDSIASNAHCASGRRVRHRTGSESLGELTSFDSIFEHLQTLKVS
jgi:hypothetical protein